MRASELTEQRVNLAYEGPTLRTMLWLLITFVVSIFIVSAAWATAFLYRRILPQISFSDGTRAAFQGRAGQVWGWFVLPAILYVMCIVVGGIVYNGEPFSLILLSEDIERSIAANGDAVTLAFVNAMFTVGILAIVVTFFSVYVQLVIVRWAIAGINLSDGPELHFAGRYARLLVWFLHYVFSFFTIIGWAWVGSAYLRWFARNIIGAGVRFEFHGSGWGILWRAFGIAIVGGVIGVVADMISDVLDILGVIWYLWAVVWLLRWLIRNVVLVRSAPSPGMATTEM